MKAKIANIKQTLILVSLLAVLNVPIRMGATGIMYNVDWPDIHLDGTFTLEVGSGFGTYFSTAASGLYGGLNDSFDAVWNSVKFECRPDFAELTFIWDQGYTGYASSPSYVGRSSPWTSAEQAWQDLIAKGKTDGVFITIRDITPPQIKSISATPNTLWPPNRRMIPIRVMLEAVDDLDPSPAVRITEVRSNEPHGGFEPDWQITGPLSLNLKAERFGRKGGRTYTIVVECEDRDGNIALASVDVVVPHDRR
jgi:hypothetical protein